MCICFNPTRESSSEKQTGLNGALVLQDVNDKLVAPALAMLPIEVFPLS